MEEWLPDNRLLPEQIRIGRPVSCIRRPNRYHDFSKKDNRREAPGVAVAAGPRQTHNPAAWRANSGTHGRNYIGTTSHMISPDWLLADGRDTVQGEG